MTGHYLFIGGAPRSGTSMLSSLVGNISGIRVAQDLCLFFYLKKAFLRVALQNQGIRDHRQLESCLFRAVVLNDISSMSFLEPYLSASPEEVLNSKSEFNGEVLRTHLSYLDGFLFSSLNVPDPRKDRGQGFSYIKSLDFNAILGSSSMREALIEAMRQSTLSLSDNLCGENDSPIFCEKAPENVVAIDLIDSVFGLHGYRFLHLVRDPVSVFGSRRQRYDDGVEGFVSFFSDYAVPRFETQNCVAFSSIRYEDIVSNPSRALRDAFDALGLEVGSKSFEFINPGKYVKYVGNTVDASRDLSNRSLVSKDEADYIYRHLSGYCETYGYGIC